MLSAKIAKRVNYEPSEDIYIVLEQYRKQNKTEGFKATLEGLIHDLLTKNCDTEGQYPYLTWTFYENKAEKSEEVAVAPVHSQGSPSSTEQPPQTQGPDRRNSDARVSEAKKAGTRTQMRSGEGQHVRYLDRSPENSERVIELATMQASLKDGVWTFSRKQQEALAFTTALMVIKQEHTQKIEKIKTDGHRERAAITENLHRELAIIHKRKPYDRRHDGEIIDSNPYGGPVDDAIRSQYTS